MNHVVINKRKATLHPNFYSLVFHDTTNSPSVKWEANTNGAIFRNMTAGGKNIFCNAMTLSILAILQGRSHTQEMWANANWTPCFCCFAFLLLCLRERKNMKLGR